MTQELINRQSSAELSSCSRGDMKPEPPKDDARARSMRQQVMLHSFLYPKHQ